MGRRAARFVLGAGHHRSGRIAMRLLAMACALIVMTCVAVFGAVMSQRAAAPVAAPVATSEPSARSIITTIEEQPAPSPAMTTTGKASESSATAAAPVLAAAPLPAPAAQQRHPLQPWLHNLRQSPPRPRRRRHKRQRQRKRLLLQRRRRIHPTAPAIPMRSVYRGSWK